MLANKVQNKPEIPNTRKLIKISSIRDEWKSKTPLEKWSIFYGIGKTSHRLLKVSFFESDQKLNWFSYFPFFYIFVLMMLAFYTVIYYTLHGEISKSFPCTCFFAGPVLGVFLASNFSISQVNRIDFSLHFRLLRLCIMLYQKIDLKFMSPWDLLDDTFIQTNAMRKIKNTMISVHVIWMRQ